jgi:cell division protein FtsN
MTSRTAARPPQAARRRPVPSRKSGFGGTLFGIFIGVALGLSLAAVVAFYLLKAGNPYASPTPAREPARDVAKDSPRSGRADANGEKPRFDFYKILPGVEEPRVPKPGAQDKAVATGAQDKAVAKLDERALQAEKADKAAADKAAKAPERFWLQAGSFSTESDAENLRARLALAGWEAAIQPVSLPDKGQRYRVRLGPYDNTEELNRMKTELAKRGFDAAVIK